MSKSEVRIVPLAEWGRDHWSMLGYVEAVCVDRRGVVDPVRMRCNPFRHPGLARHQHSQPEGPYRYPTRLKTGEEPEHDDHDCLADFEAEGLIEYGGTGMHPEIKLTVKGQLLANEIRAHKAAGGSFGNFQPRLVWAPPTV